MKENNNIVCNPITGICCVPDEDIDFYEINSNKEKVEVYYFTDPICSHCFALEPIFNKFKYMYGEYINVNIILGGLLETWDDFSDNIKGVSVPETIYNQWQEIKSKLLYPLDGSLWKNNPITSSYPASYVYEIIEQDYPKKSDLFLRLIRLETFVFNKNVSDFNVLSEIVSSIGLDGEKIIARAKKDGPTLLDQDIYTTEHFNVQLFPTIIMVNTKNQGVKIANTKNYKAYVDTLNKLYENKEHLIPIALPDLQTLLDKKNILFESEIRYYYDNHFDKFLEYIDNNLEKGTYTINNILGHTYIQKK